MISLLEELASKPGSATAPSPSADKRNELRFWTSRNGHQIQATLIDCKPTTVVLKRHDNDKSIEVSIDSLCQEDRDYLSSLAEQQP